MQCVCQAAFREDACPEPRWKVVGNAASNMEINPAINTLSAEINTLLCTKYCN
jgi:hypothetical protein